MQYIHQLLIACPLIFLASFVDSIAGGGGLISLPTYYMVGLPPHLALGTNKFSSCIGTAFSTLVYLRGGFVYKRIVPISIVGALIGAWFGAWCAILLDEQILRWVVVFAIPALAAIIILKKDLFSPGERNMSDVREQLTTIAVTLAIGWYDGFFGPGTGTFYMMAFAGILHLNAVVACGNTKSANLASNIAAVSAFVLGGTIDYRLGIPCAAFSILGHILGAKLTVKNGAKIIRPVMLVVVGILMVTMVRDLL